MVAELLRSDSGVEAETHAGGEMEIVDVGGLEMLDLPCLGTAPDAGSPSRTAWPGRANCCVAVVLALLLGGHVDAELRGRSDARSQHAAKASAVSLFVADASLDWSSTFQPHALVVGLRNAGSRDLVLLALQSPDGGAAADPSQLPALLRANQLTRVVLEFGQVCVRDAQETRFLEATVRTSDGARRTGILEFVGDDAEIRYVTDAARDRCRAATASATRDERCTCSPESALLSGSTSRATAASGAPSTGRGRPEQAQVSARPCASTEHRTPRC